MQQGGSQYGVPPPPEMAHVLGIPGSDHLQQQQLAEAAPISSRPPPTLVVSRLSNFDELEAAAGSGNFPDEDALAAGEEVERGGAPGNRWPRQETLALLKIRSEMDAAFRDATLKGPLWEDVSRKLAELGYTRSAKKCKEKFENVHKYYKRTKEGRAGRQDGKSYRFFSQLEALHTAAGTGTGTITTAGATASPNPTSSATIGFTMAGSSARPQPTPLASAAPSISTPRIVPDPAGGIPGSAAGISFSSNTSSSAYSDSDDEGTEEGQPAETRKRKRRGSGGGGGGSGSRKMMAFFEGLMKQVMERQEAMQQRFLETIEKREQDRMIREEAWRRQEMARVGKEHEAMAQERAFSASRDAAIIAFLQKITGQTVQLPPPVPVPSPPPPHHPVPAPPPPAPPIQHQPPPHQQQQQQQPPQQHHHHHQGTEIVPQPATCSDIVPFQDPQEGGMMGISMDPASSRWPKPEVLALIKLRSGLEPRYQEAGPKGPLWEEISAGMRRMGYNRNAKRCKEKWENINKYFKKVKESNKKRPEDAKTCPYFHQLDALYRKKVLGGSGGGFPSQNKQEREMNPNLPNSQEIRTDVLAITAAPPQADSNNGNGNRNAGTPGAIGEGSAIQVPTSNGGLPVSFFEEGNGGGPGSAGAIKKPEDIVKNLMEHQQPPLKHQQQTMVEEYDKLEDPADSDNVDQEDDDDDEDDEERKMDYKIQFQRQNVSGQPNNGGNPSVAATAAAGSFLAMVQ